MLSPPRHDFSLGLVHIPPRNCQEWLVSKKPLYLPIRRTNSLHEFNESAFRVFISAVVSEWWKMILCSPFNAYSHLSPKSYHLCLCCLICEVISAYHLSTTRRVLGRPILCFWDNPEFYTSAAFWILAQESLVESKVCTDTDTDTPWNAH